ncbi:MAG: DNA repair exonuclease [Gemmatimonadaceae bacterium]|nr:DNA repair exonuclease [Gemmatimonadaceae bacterium]
MRLVHLADLHLGFRQYHRLTPTGINQREADVAHAFRRAIDRVIALAPDIVVIAGDIFHTVRPMNPAIIDAFTQFARLTTELPNAIVVMVAGNHDRPRATETGCILKLFQKLGIHVVVDEPKRLQFPGHDLSILAVPDITGPRPDLSPDPTARHNVLVMHGEVEGVLPHGGDRAAMEIPRSALSASRWSYIALGHYHVHQRIEKNAYYSGSLEYTSTDPWGELDQEAQLRLPGKGFIEWDLERSEHTFHHIPASRALVSLDSIAARGMSAAEIDIAVRAACDDCEGGIEEKIVRLVVRDVPRHIVRELDSRALRELKRRAMHFQLDTRRPDAMRPSGIGASGGRRPTLVETVTAYLQKRPLDDELDRAALVQLGLEYLKQADDVDAASAAAPRE